MKDIFKIGKNKLLGNTYWCCEFNLKRKTLNLELETVPKNNIKFKKSYED